MTSRALNGATVRVLREALGISQKDLAARAEISQGALSNIEQGMHGSKPTTNRRIADAMGVALEAITYPVPDEAPAREPVGAEAQ